MYIYIYIHTHNMCVCMFMWIVLLPEARGVTEWTDQGFRV